MKKTLLFLVFMSFVCMGAKAQISFRVQSDGTFLTTDGKKYIELECPGFTQEELYYAYLVTIEHKCVTSGVQFSTVGNKCINVYSYEKYFSSYSVWNGGFAGYLYYKFMFQFKDGKVRFQPIIHSLSTPLNIYFGYEGKKQSPHNINMFKQDGSVRGKNGKLFSEALDKWLNKLVSEYDQFMKTGGGEDDW